MYPKIIYLYRDAINEVTSALFSKLAKLLDNHILLLSLNIF